MTILTADRAIALYGDPGHGNEPDPHWVAEHIVYCGGGGRAPLPPMPGVPPKFWFAVHRRAEPKMRAGFAAAAKACPSYVIERAGCFVYRHQRHDPRLPLSNHSWGAAVDVDAPLNASRTLAPGESSLMKPWSAAWDHYWPHGLPRAWVDAFLSVGGIGWGGAWRPFVDPMHFEVYDPG